MRNVSVIEKGITFNKSVKTEWVVVHDVKKGIYFGTNGITQSKKTMFVGTEVECDEYIEDNSIVFPEEEIIKI